MNKHLTLVKKIAEGGFGIYSIADAMVLAGKIEGTPESFIEELYEQIFPKNEMESAKESMISIFGQEIVNEITELGK